MTFISRKQVFLALLEHFSYPLLGFSPLPLLWLLVRACSSELRSDFSVSWRFSAETRAVRSAPAASKRKMPNPPFILHMYRITKTTNHSGRGGQDDKKNPGCGRRAIHLSITRGFSDLAHLCKSMKKTSKQDYKIDHFFKSTQKTRDQKQKPRERLTGDERQRLLVPFSPQMERDKIALSSSLTQISWLMATCSSRTTIQCDHHTLIKSMSAERPARLQWFTLIIHWSLNSLRFHPSSPDIWSDASCKDASCFWFSVKSIIKPQVSIRLRDAQSQQIQS